ncbi:hypothetical protein EDC01DRAFT_633515 [Geopyxis carbonaria]|nr:hypothetical protein EDC01DRAFT_633515 [Geopyxis carbonaria]
MTITEKNNTVLVPTVDVPTSVPRKYSKDEEVSAEIRDETPAPAPALFDAYVGSEMLVEDVPSLGVAKGIMAGYGKNKGKRGKRGKGKEASAVFKEADDNAMDEQEGWWKAGS